jgi:two-component system cell cycle sensor histidine kinase/response regulator CckA
LLALDPGVKAIVESGYSNDPVMADYKKFGFKAIIVKPYTLDVFSKTLRDVLQ